MLSVKNTVLVNILNYGVLLVYMQLLWATYNSATLVSIGLLSYADKIVRPYSNMRYKK